MFVIALLVGLVLLVVGAEMLVRGAGQLALAFRVPALVVGLTVVAFGTSAPELSVSVAAAFTASTEMALSNVNGSNVANIALVLGLAALIRPLVVRRDMLRRDVPSLMVLQMLVPLMCLDGRISRVDGAVLFSVGVGYNAWLLFDALRGRMALDPDDEIEASGRWWYDGLLLVLGSAVLVFGASIFVDGAVSTARWAGLSDRFIGLTVVALGTSAPEVATAVSSAYRGNTDLAVGNSIGSNILNIAMVLGITSMILPIQIQDPGVWTDFGFALAVTCLLVPMVLSRRLGRSGGAVLVIGYVAYIAVGYLSA